MASGRGLRRYLGVLRIEEEQAQATLELALAQQRELERAIQVTVEGERRARKLYVSGVEDGNAVDRHAALEEIGAAQRRKTVLRLRMARTEKAVADAEQVFLERRIERRQCESLLAEADARAAAEAARRNQQSLDDWYLQGWSREEEPST